MLPDMTSWGNKVGILAALFRPLQSNLFPVEIHLSMKFQRTSLVGGKKGNRTEPNRTNGLYRTEPTKISDCCGIGFYLRHRTEPNECDIYSLFYHYFFSVY